MDSSLMTSSCAPGSLRSTGRSVLSIVWMPALLALFATHAAAVTIDDFSAAGATKQPPGLMRSTVGSTTVTDSNLSGVIGSVRQLTVAMTFAATAADYISAGASTAFAVLDYASTAGANGRFELLYNRGGAGLNVDLSPATGIRVAVLAADADSSPYVVSVSLVDNASHTASSSQTVTVSGPQTIDFSFSNFAPVDVTHLFSVKVIVDSNKAADLRLGLIETFPTVTLTPTATPGLTEVPTKPIDVPTATPTATNTATNTTTPTLTATAIDPTKSPTPSQTAIATATNTLAPTATSTSVPTKTSTATSANTAVPTSTPSNTATNTTVPTSTSTPTGTPSRTPTSSPTDAPPDCSKAVPSQSRLSPPNHTFHSVSILGVTDPNGDPVTITITGITQDEGITHLGAGDGCPDGLGVGMATATLRAERSGTGDGRVYHVNFTADDGKGAQCTGTVLVCVPHEGSRTALCVDQGPLVNSTGPCS